MKEMKLSQLDLKILSIVYHLNKIDKYPNQNGVFKMLKGVEDFETKNYLDIPGFSSCISLTSKRLSFRILSLLRYGFLLNIYDEKSDKFYLKIQGKGQQEITHYLTKHPHGFKQNKKSEEVCIITIKK